MKVASIDALDAVKTKPSRVCPLVCEHGFRADGDSCANITCRAGYRVSDDNECEKIPDKKPVATRDDSKKRDEGRKEAESASGSRASRSRRALYLSSGRAAAVVKRVIGSACPAGAWGASR